MGKIYVGQDFKIIITVNEDITGAQSTKIAYKKSDGTNGEWTANIVDAGQGKISYDVLDTENTVTGILTVWARIRDSDGLYYPSEPSSITIYKEGM